MKFIAQKTLGILALTAIATAANASALQRFGGISFSNPADYGFVKDEAMIVGDKINWGTLEYKGTAAGGSGTVDGHHRYQLPYFRFVKRFFTPYTNQVVVGIDVTEPFAVTENYPKSSFVAYNSTFTKFTSLNLAPSIAFNVTDYFSIGLGFDAMYLKFATGFLTPPFISGGEFAVNQNSWGYGWHAGLTYIFNECTSLGLAYYSKVSQQLSGVSNLSGFPTSGVYTRFTLPTTSLLYLRHKFTPKWSFFGNLSRTWWHFDTMTFYNTSLGNLDLPLDFRDTWRISLNNLYAFDDCWGIWFGAAYDQGAAINSRRTIGAEAVSTVNLLLGAHWRATPTLTFDGFVTHGWSVGNTSVNQPQAPFFAVGKYDTKNNSVELRMSWNMDVVPVK